MREADAYIRREPLTDKTCWNPACNDSVYVSLGMVDLG
jgi:hypothetical protein